MTYTKCVWHHFWWRHTLPLFGKMHPWLHFWSLVTSGSSNLFSMGRLGCLPFQLGFFQRKCCSPTRRHLSTFQVVVVHMAWSCRTFVQLFGLLKQDMDRCIKEIQSIPSREYALKDMLHTARHIVGSCPSQRTATLYKSIHLHQSSYWIASCYASSGPENKISGEGSGVRSESPLRVLQCPSVQELQDADIDRIKSLSDF